MNSSDKRSAPEATVSGQKEAPDEIARERVFAILETARQYQDAQAEITFLEAILLLWACWSPDQIPTRLSDGSLTWRAREVSEADSVSDDRGGMAHPFPEDSVVFQ